MPSLVAPCPSQGEHWGHLAGAEAVTYFAPQVGHVVLLKVKGHAHAQAVGEPVVWMGSK